MTLLPDLQAYVAKAAQLTADLSSERTEKLGVLANYIAKQKEEGAPIQLNFICTHNSRRSHLGQLWAAVAAHVHGLENVTTFSGGTEATAFNPRAVAAIKRAGFEVKSPGGDNPRYEVRYADGEPAAVCFSKCFDDAANPATNFAAVMTCTDADKNCPAIIGATRISLPYRDPKEADDTPEEAARYDERCLQIATEMLWVFQQVSGRAS